MKRITRYWTPVEDKILREAWDERGEDCLVDVASTVGRTLEAVRVHARRVGILTTPKKRTRWSDLEVATFHNEWSSALPANINAERIAGARTRKAARDEGEAIPAAYQAFHERLRAEREAGVF